MPLDDLKGQVGVREIGAAIGVHHSTISDWWNEDRDRRFEDAPHVTWGLKGRRLCDAEEARRWIRARVARMPSWVVKRLNL
ncbi:MAG: hypothetical protein KDA71_23535 [Planctomycetales bacterium]|nr:hypothetical protein [Planctomycetales bacterium]